MTNRAPLIAAILLLLLPVLYVGSYFALVLPQARVARVVIRGGGQRFLLAENSCYRWEADWVANAFWPLEQIDRKARPKTWDVE